MPQLVMAVKKALTNSEIAAADLNRLQSARRVGTSCLGKNSCRAKPLEVQKI